MTQQSNTIDISPEKVAPLAQAGIVLLNLSSTLVPGNMRAQIGVLEILLSGLASGHLVLAPAPKSEVESDAKTDEKTDKPNTGPNDDADDSGSTSTGDGAAQSD